MGRNKKKECTSIPVLVEGNNIVEEALEKESFNRYFNAVFSFPLVPNDQHWVSNIVVIKPIESILFDIHGIQRLLEELNTSKAAGPDNLPNALLLSFAPPLWQHTCQ